LSAETEVEFDEGKVRSRISEALRPVQAALDAQILKDANYFCPEDKGDLQSSAVRESRIGEGELVWATPYARRLYYNPQFNFSKDRNPNARGKWFEAAKAANFRAWERIAQAALT
jgi:hypothetical protein